MTPGRRKARTVWSLIKAVVLLGLLLFSVYFGVLLYRANDTVENMSTIMSQAASKPTVIWSADGVKLAEFRANMQEPATLAEIPKNMENATIAAEDKRFWQHSGIDPIGIARAGWTSLTGGQLQGGSTLAQQLAKRLFTSQERTVSRKVQDMALAIQLERKLTKEQILELYLNQVYYGSGAYGVKAAARVYFGKSLEKVTLGECALLARLPRRPSAENPFVDRKAAIRNRDTVLGLMLDQELITKTEYDNAKAEKVRLAERRAVAQGDWKAPYAVSEAVRELRGILDSDQVYEGGYKIELTLDYRMQKAAEDALDRVIRASRGRGVTDGAAYLMDLQGRTLVLIGGSDFQRDQFNMITQGLRQPGSSFKPLMYSIAFELGELTPNSIVYDTRHTYGGLGMQPYTPDDSDGKYMGHITVRTALKLSRNAAAVYANDKVGPGRVAQEIQSRFGFSNKIRPVLSLPLGATEVRPIEMASAFSVFATGGNRVQPYLVARVTGPDGTVLHKGAPIIRREVLSRDTADAIDSILRDAVRSGTGRAAARVPNAHGKTGTTSLHKDAWFVGYAGNYVGLAWVGNPVFDAGSKRWVYRPMHHVFGGAVPILIWRDMMLEIAKLPGVDLEQRTMDAPQETSTGVTVRVCLDSGQLATSACAHTERQRFVPGTQPTAYCPLHVPDNAGPNGTGKSPDNAVIVQPHEEIDSPEASTSNVDDMVTIYICADSGLPANPYCPEAVPRSFKKGKVPRGVCRKHGP